jgi:hypothetical protein
MIRAKAVAFNSNDGVEAEPLPTSLGAAVKSKRAIAEDMIRAIFHYQAG